MKHLLFLIFAVQACLPGFAACDGRVRIVPRPAEVEELPGSFRLTPRTPVVITDEQLRTPAEIFARAVGKLTGPIMFYMAVEGFHHTRSIRRYLARLAVFAGVSYFPFLYFCAMGQPEQMDPLRLNVIYTILLGVLAVWVRRRPWPAPLRAVLLLLLACLSIPGDWGIWGFSIIVVLDFYYGDFRNQAFGYTLVVLFAVNTVSLLTGPAYDLLYLGGLSSPADYLLGVENLGMFLPLLLLRYYDGTRGTDRPWGKWLFYLFYPAHLLLLGLLAHILL